MKISLVILSGLFFPTTWGQSGVISVNSRVPIAHCGRLLPVRKFLLTVLILVFFTGPLRATSYYMSADGNDSNTGVSASSPWLTPNHTGLSCGDTITAASGNYTQMIVTAQPACSRHDAVWVNCVVFDTCKISYGSADDYSQGVINIRASNWAFTGWETTGTAGHYMACFSAVPGPSAKVNMHDVYFINDVANGCQGGGFNSDNTGRRSVDYIVYIADIAYNTTQSSDYCYSGFNVLQPTAWDRESGTHIYSAQIFAWQNLEPDTCAGTNSTDGEGIIYDTFNGINGPAIPYDQQAVIENALMIYNGAAGILEGGAGNSSSHIVIRNSTAYGNFISINQGTRLCGQIQSVGFPETNPFHMNRLTLIDNNLAYVGSATISGCGTNPAYAYMVGNVDSTTTVSGNAGYSEAGQDIGMIGLRIGFTAARGNIFGKNPDFANPAEPAAPDCTGKANVIDCMSTVIANFTPTNSALTSYGYQRPSSTPDDNPYFPRFLCDNPNMPTGLVTMGCLKKKL